jgi:hypothetical protein
MTTAISYAYTHFREDRPSPMNQFRRCRNHAATLGYTIVAELNDIDPTDYIATGKLLNELHQATTEQGVNVVLVYQPSAWVYERLYGIQAEIEDVGTLIELERAA